MTYNPNTTSADIIDGAITNSDINASAGIVDTKLNLSNTVSTQTIGAAQPTGGVSTNRIVDAWSDFLLILVVLNAAQCPACKQAE